MFKFGDIVETDLDFFTTEGKEKIWGVVLDHKFLDGTQQYLVRFKVEGVHYDKWFRQMWIQKKVGAVNA